MSTPLSEREIHSRESEQKADIFFRQLFLTLNTQTQQKIVDLLERMAKSVVAGKRLDAQKYFFTTMSKHRRNPNGDYEDRHGVDWGEVDDQIKHFCFSDHDMEGYMIVERRVGQALTVFKSLMELPREDAY